MKAWTQLLAATDLSAPARHAADRAARLAHETGAQLTLLHVLQADAIGAMRRWLGQDSAAERALYDQARQQLEALRAELASLRQVPVQTRLCSGALLQEIDQTARTLDAGVLVLGARGEGFLRRMVLGTTAERLIRRSDRPVLVVRQQAHEPYRRVLVPVDFSPWSRAALDAARRVAPHARLVVFHAFQVPFEEKLHFAGVEAATIERYRQQARQQATQQLHALAHDAGLRPGQWEACIVEGDASQRIVEQEQARDCDLVAVGKHGQSAAEDLLLGSVTKHVLAEGSGDVLVSTGNA